MTMQGDRVRLYHPSGPCLTADYLDRLPQLAQEVTIADGLPDLLTTIGLALAAP